MILTHLSPSPKTTLSMKYKISRREFTKTTAAAFTILKAGSALTYAANEKLNIVSVGAGGQAERPGHGFGCPVGTVRPL